MAVPILTNVKSEKQTHVARVVALAVTLVNVAVLLKWIDLEQAKQLLAIANDENFRLTIGAIFALIVAALPSVQGWRSADKELPDGWTTDDVIIIPNREDDET